VRLAFPLRPYDISEELESLADEFAGTYDTGIGKEAGPLNEAFDIFRQGNGIKDPAFAQIHTSPSVDKLPVLTETFLGTLHIIFLQAHVPGQKTILATGPEPIAKR
jgi:hypothetical protein